MITAEQKDKLIDQIMNTQDEMSDYPKKADGSNDFKAKLVTSKLSRDDVAFLVEKYCEHIEGGMSHGEACRITYACAYKSTDIRFNPAQRVAELRAS